MRKPPVKYKNVARLLKALNAGQGHASLTCDWDGVSGEPKYSITVYRERDGETYKKDAMTEEYFIRALNSLSAK